MHELTARCEFNRMVPTTYCSSFKHPMYPFHTEADMAKYALEQDD